MASTWCCTEVSNCSFSPSFVCLDPLPTCPRNSIDPAPAPASSRSERFSRLELASLVLLVLLSIHSSMRRVRVSQLFDLDIRQFARSESTLFQLFQLTSAPTPALSHPVPGHLVRIAMNLRIMDPLHSWRPIAPTTSRSPPIALDTTETSAARPREELSKLPPQWIPIITTYYTRDWAPGLPPFRRWDRGGCQGGRMPPNLRIWAGSCSDIRNQGFVRSMARVFVLRTTGTPSDSGNWII